MSELEHKMSQRSKVILVFFMALGVMLFGMIIPYNLTAEATHSALFIAMVLGCGPMYFLFVYVRRNMISKNPHVKENKGKIFLWAFIFSSVFHTPILVLNRITASPFNGRAKITKVNDSISHRMYIHPPHIIFMLQGKEHSLKISRDRMGKFHVNESLAIMGQMGGLGYIVEANVN
jgi:hypothetical protein